MQSSPAAALPPPSSNGRHGVTATTAAISTTSMLQCSHRDSAPMLPPIGCGPVICTAVVEVGPQQAPLHIAAIRSSAWNPPSVTQPDDEAAGVTGASSSDSSNHHYPVITVLEWNGDARSTASATTGVVCSSIPMTCVGAPPELPASVTRGGGLHDDNGCRPRPVEVSAMCSIPLPAYGDSEVCFPVSFRHDRTVRVLIRSVDAIGDDDESAAVGRVAYEFGGSFLVKESPWSSCCVVSLHPEGGIVAAMREDGRLTLADIRNKRIQRLTNESAPLEVAVLSAASSSVAVRQLLPLQRSTNDAAELLHFDLLALTPSCLMRLAVRGVSQLVQVTQTFQWTHSDPLLCCCLAGPVIMAGSSSGCLPMWSLHAHGSSPQQPTQTDAAVVVTASDATSMGRVIMPAATITASSGAITSLANRCETSVEVVVADAKGSMSLVTLHRDPAGVKAATTPLFTQEAVNGPAVNDASSMFNIASAWASVVATSQCVVGVDVSGAISVWRWTR